MHKHIQTGLFSTHNMVKNQDKNVGCFRNQIRRSVILQKNYPPTTGLRGLTETGRI